MTERLARKNFWAAFTCTVIWNSVNKIVDNLPAFLCVDLERIIQHPYPFKQFWPYFQLLWCLQSVRSNLWLNFLEIESVKWSERSDSLLRIVYVWIYSAVSYSFCCIRCKLVQLDIGLKLSLSIFRTVLCVLTSCWMFCCSLSIQF